MAPTPPAFGQVFDLSEVPTGLTCVFYDYNDMAITSGSSFSDFINAQHEKRWCGAVSQINWPDRFPKAADSLDFMVTGDFSLLEDGMFVFKHSGDFFDEASINEELFALKCCGYIYLPGPWVEFNVLHDDGVRMIIGGDEVLVFDAPTDARETKGISTKGAGWFPIQIELFEQRIETNLVMKWRTSGGDPFVLVPSDKLGLKDGPGDDIAPADGIPDVCETDFISSVGNCGGDPHFKRWGQQTRDSFHGECDLVLAHSDNFYNGAGLDIHIRTTMRQYYSYIEAAALRIGNHVLEVSKDNFMLGGTPFEDSDLPLVFGDNGEFKFQLVHQEGDRSNYMLDFGHGSQVFFKFYKKYLNIDTTGHVELVDNTGLLGSYPKGEMVARDGSIMENFEEFGFEWQVTPEDAQLFHEARSPQLPYEKCHIPTAARPSRRHLRAQDRKLHEEAVKACASQTGSDVDLCIDDVMMTGDIGLAKNW